MTKPVAIELTVPEDGRGLRMTKYALTYGGQKRDDVEVSRLQDADTGAIIVVVQSSKKDGRAALNNAQMDAVARRLEPKAVPYSGVNGRALSIRRYIRELGK